MNYIYKITNLINDKIYVGRTNNPQGRWRVHKSCSHRQNDYKSKLYSAMRKHGECNFFFEIIESNVSADLINERERHWIMLFDSKNNGYNCTDGGDGILNPTTETRRKMSVAKKDIPLTEKHKMNLSTAQTGEKNNFYGKTHSDEQKMKWSVVRRGRTLTEEHKKNVSLAVSGEKNGFYNKTHSPEVRKIISDKNKEFWTDEKKLDRSEKNKRLVVEHRSAGIFHPNSRKCIANDVLYNSVVEASKSLGVTKKTLRKRINSDKIIFSGYRYV